MAKHMVPEETVAPEADNKLIGHEPLPIYPGNMPLGRSMESLPRPDRTIGSPRQNRKAVRRRVSPFNIMLMLIAAAIAIVLYISNIIAVNQLLHEVNALEREQQQILMEQEILKAQINRLASLEKIQEKADQLGLRSLREPPVWLSIDPERLRSVERETGRKD
ncbi:MAG: hypothetical protein HY563_06635 [Ignavibacteriales bacterium]|nr:hypothetical protein [Ignavibacteriales bacterium]